jgi:aminoacylase
LSFLPDEEIGGVDGMLALIASEEFKSLGRIGIAIDEGLANEQDAYTVFYGECVGPAFGGG